MCELKEIFKIFQKLAQLKAPFLLYLQVAFSIFFGIVRTYCVSKRRKPKICTVLTSQRKLTSLFFNLPPSMFGSVFFRKLSYLNEAFQIRNM